MEEQKLNALLIRHSLAAESLNKSLANKIVRLLNSADADLVGTLAARYALIEGKGRDTGPATTKRLNDLLEGVRAINSGVYAKVSKGVTLDLTDLATHEAEFAAKAAKAAGVKVDLSTAIPSAQLLKTLVERTPIPVDQHGAALLKPWIEGMETNRFKRLEGAIRVGLVNGETTDDLVKRIRGTKAAEYTDGILDISRKSAQTFAITANSSVQNAARLETFKNMKTIGFVEWSSILDSRTSTICQSRSGTIYDINGPHPAPPAHPRCRSLLLPRRNNTDPAKHKPFGEWLREQPDEVHDEVLGPERAKIFRANPDADFSKTFFRDNGSYRSLDELKKFDEAMFAKAEKAAPAPAPKAEPKPEPVAPKRFTSPIDPEVRADTIKVRPRKESVKALTGRVEAAAADPRYDPRPEFRGIKPDQLGKVAMGSTFSDQSASMVAALFPELDRLSDAFGIPRLRAIRQGTGSYIATMGDGTLTLNPTYLNGYAATVGGGEATSVATTVIADRDAIVGELRTLREKIDAAKAKAKDLIGTAKDEAIIEYVGLVDQFNGKRKEWVALDKRVLKARRTDSASSKPISTWKPGDDTKDRPYNTTDYFEGIDRTRNVFFHEFGHHVHQYLGKQGRRNLVGKPPLEKQLARMFFEKFHGSAPGNLKGAGLERKKLVASTYATTNEFEWWAENFSLYMMGRVDLVEPEIKELIERLLDEVANAST